jgi:hypothetical protein
MTHKHTPGSWAYSSDGRILRDVDDWTVIARVTHAPILANARLIAAAPDLLTAVVLTLTQLDGAGMFCSGDEPADLLRAAVAKARGEE